MLNILVYMKKKCGATAIEYSLLIAGIAIILTISAFVMGDEIEALFIELADGISQR